VRRFLADWGPALLWGLLIFALSTRSTLPVEVEAGVDKLVHFSAYLLLGAALSWGGVRRRMAPLAVLALGAAYGGSDELHQLFVPGRSADVLDWFADVAGIAVAVALFHPLFARLAARGEARSRLP
jgi:VanZ family protein